MISELEEGEAEALDLVGQLPAIIQPPVPDFDTEFVKAKTFLQKCSSFSGDNLYDHLTDVLNKILAERPENVIDFFEEYSRKVKEKRFKPQTDHLEDIFVNTNRYNLAVKLQPFLRPPPPREASTVDPEDEEIADMTRNNMLDLLRYFEAVGVGLPKTEMFALYLSMRKFIKEAPIATIRFWGKIYGVYKNYLVLECDLKEEEYMRRNEEAMNKLEEEQAQEALNQDEVEKALDEIAKGQEEGGGEEGVPPKTGKYPRPLPPAPVIQYVEPPEPPSEPSGVGVNKKVYYVCNEVGDPWIELPDVTPKQIRVARKIIKSFTGNLETPIIVYPEFTGVEKNYLRAQIARISAGTQISPLGFYTFGGGGGGEGEEPEEGAGAGGGMRTTYNENPKYDPVPIRDLTDGSMSFWVHHTLYILPQGRTSWWNPNPGPEGAGEELGEDMGEGEEEGGGGPPRIAGPEPETGPPLLTPLSEDASLEAVPPWSVRVSSDIVPEFSIAVVRSNLWHGAYCFATQGKPFQNVYFGFGHKFISTNFSPMPLPPIEQEYPTGPEIMEVDDPTGAMEEEWRIAHLPKPKPEKPEEMPEEEEAEEEEDEDEDEDDDDDD